MACSLGRAPPSVTIKVLAPRPSVPKTNCPSDGSFDALDQRGGRAVAEDGPQRTVGRIDIFRIGFGGDQQHPLGRAAADQTVGQRQPIDKARTSQIEIQRADRSRQPQSLLHQAGGGGQNIVGRLRAKQEEVDRFAVDVVPFEQPFGRRNAQVRCTLIRRGYMPVPNACLGKNLFDVPFVEHRGQLFYVFDFFRQMNGNGANRGIRHNLLPTPYLQNSLPQPPGQGRKVPNSISKRQHQTNHEKK